ncbi:unnamed protein product, partial [Coregonus sp. 'balchen']
ADVSHGASVRLSSRPPPAVHHLHPPHVVHLAQTLVSPRLPLHHPSTARPAFTQNALNCGGEPFQVLYNYAPRNEDELELKEGDVVDVMERCDDGWFV